MIAYRLHLNKAFCGLYEPLPLEQTITTILESNYERKWHVIDSKHTILILADQIDAAFGK